MWPRARSSQKTAVSKPQDPATARLQSLPALFERAKNSIARRTPLMLLSHVWAVEEGVIG